MNTSSEYLYHYTKRETLIEFILPSLKLKMNTLMNTNDPKEKKISLFNYFDNVKYAGTYIDMKIILKEILDNEYKICCFSGDFIEDGIGFSGMNLPRMWATYGDKHKGVCLKINLEKFCEENSVDDKTRILKKVNYLSRLNHRLTYSEPDIDIDNRKAVELLINDNMDTLFFEKHKDWETEKEIRFVSFEKRDYCSIKDSLDTILLGIDFDNKYLPSISSQLSKGIRSQRVLYDFKTSQLKAAKK